MGLTAKLSSGNPLTIQTSISCTGSPGFKYSCDRRRTCALPTALSENYTILVMTFFCYHSTDEHNLYELLHLPVFRKTQSFYTPHNSLMSIYIFYLPQKNTLMR